jgi:hypothetical protein
MEKSFLLRAERNFRSCERIAEVLQPEDAFFLLLIEKEEARFKIGLGKIVDFKCSNTVH